MDKIGLCMIVKNEAHIIERCLASVLPLVDYVLLVDTGSTDETCQVAAKFLAAKDIPCSFLEAEWVDFATNRSQALEAIRNCGIDYVLMMDADEVLWFSGDFDHVAFKESLTADLYEVEIHLGGTIYTRPQLFKNSMPFFYKGVVHEYLECSEPIGPRDKVKDFFIEPIQDSARNKSGDKFLKDVEVLRKAMREEKDRFLHSRYTFYLAQTYRDLGQYENAYLFYTERARMGGWQEEVYWSLYQAAQMGLKMDFGDKYLTYAFLTAYEALPTRAEALHGAAKNARMNNQFHHAYLLAKQGLNIPMPKEGLFLEEWVYEYGMLDEFAVSAYWAGHYQESLDACKELLKNQNIPAQDTTRIFSNLEHALNKIKNKEVVAHE